MRNIQYLIVHCSATRAGKDYTVQDIDRWHRERGFARIGYHYVIYRDGSVHAGRSEGKVGVHVSGFNTNSIGICYIGGLHKDGITPEDTRTPEQRTALRKLLRELRGRYPKARICGHRDFAKKACPCFNAREEYKDI